MLPPAVVEQQAKLGVSAEESKTERLKRQQARFRDRGGAFVPSDSNPLIDILLARTVSGESPSKPRPRDVAVKRRSPSKARHALPTQKGGDSATDEQVQTLAGSSKSKPPVSRKRKAKVVEPEADATSTAPKRRGRPPKGKKKVPDLDSDTERQLVPKTTSKPKGRKGNTVPSKTDGKQKLKAKAKSNPAKKVVEVLSSDDDQTLVEVLPKAKSNSKRNLPHEDNSETDDDAPLVRKRAKPQVHPSKASDMKTTSRVNTGNSGKKKLEDREERTRGDKYSKSDVKKRPVSRDDDDDDDLAPPTKRGKVANAASAKPQIADVKNRENIKATGKVKGKGRTEPDQSASKPVEDDDEQPPERVTKAKKRKKEDNYDDWPRKAVKFSESGPSHSSSQKLKENLSDGKRKSTIEPSTKDKPYIAHSKPATKPPSRAKTFKGPPREVLERIKASAARHLRCADSEPDELDCLS